LGQLERRPKPPWLSQGRTGRPHSVRPRFLAILPSLIEGYAGGTPTHFRLYFWLTGAQRRTSYSAAHRQTQSCLRRVATEVQPVAIPKTVIRRWPVSPSFLAAGNTGVPETKVRRVATLQSSSCDWGGPPDDLKCATAKCEALSKVADLPLGLDPRERLGYSRVGTGPGTTF
jgi:hypothetical protein